ncbi:MAG: type II toxin-antitoxin system HicA family toxin [Parcubacteria group bacterium]
MSKLFSSQEIIRTLKKKGFYFVSQRGSHAKFKKKNGKSLIVIVPMDRKEIPEGTFHSILKQANLEKDDFK